MHIEKVCQVQNMPSPIKHIKYGLESFNKSHGRQKYVQKSKPVSCFFKPAQSTSKKKTISSVSQTIRWNSSSNLFCFSCSTEKFLIELVYGLLYQKMFLDSETAKSYKMERAELGYVINFGLALYLHRILTENVKRSPYYSVSFDERQNDSFRNCQMNLNIWF